MKIATQRLDPHALQPRFSADCGDFEPPEAWALDDFDDLLPSVHKPADNVAQRRHGRRDGGSR